MKDENVIYVKKYDAGNEVLFPINRREIWRYAGYYDSVKKPDRELEDLLDGVIKEVKDSFCFQVCYRRMKLSWENDMPVLPFPCASKGLAKCLSGSDEVVLFAATIGLEVDRYIARWERFSPTKALLMHAYGAERIESLCDFFCGEIQSEVSGNGRLCSPRFSPGYGDLPIETQVDFFRCMDCSRKIGVSLNDSLLMTPSKSVTAIFGIRSCGQGETCTMETMHKCENCDNLSCGYREIADKKS